MRMNAAEARQRLPELLRTASAGEVVMVDVHGKSTAAIVSAEVGEHARRLGASLVTMADIEAAAQAIKKIAGVESVVLFGSYARGDAGASSDVDLLVVINRLSNRKGGGPFWEVYSEITQTLIKRRRADGRRLRCEIHPVTSEAWRNSTTGLIRAAKQEGIILA